MCLFVTALPGLASVPAATDWGLLETENFTLFSNLDEAGTRAIGVNLEQLRAVLVQQFPDASIDASVPTLLYVFRDRESFDPFALPGGGAGFFSPHIHANFAALVASDVAEATPIVYRQYAGELIHSEIPQSPTGCFADPSRSRYGPRASPCWPTSCGVRFRVAEGNSPYTFR